MDEIALRIEQFRKMTQADPENELGHFSLGRALLDSGDVAGAIASFQRVIQLNPNIGKVYHLLAQAQLKLGHREQAIATLKLGVKVAHSRGDLMPKNDMLKMLAELGESVPELAASHAPQQVGQGQVLCRRCGQARPKLASPPFRNDLGREIHDKVCADCWREWLAMGTKVINELRLPMVDPQAQRIYDQHMIEFLNLR